MIYFDSDVWIHSLVCQDISKYEQSRSVIKEYQQVGYVISTLNIQEILFVLAKLKIEASEINDIAKKLFEMKVESYFVGEIKRAVILAKYAGFRNINDCIHTAIAETYCSEIITYNKKDFNKIAEHTEIKVRIL